METTFIGMEFEEVTIRRKNNPTKTDVFYRVECSICGKSRLIDKYKFKKYKYKGVCFSCISKLMNKKEKVKFTCPICGEIKYMTPYYARVSKVCSLKCARISNSRMKKGKKMWWMIGENHWNWKGGITPKDKLERIRFLKTLQPEVLRRDDFTCQICGSRGVELHVDHIKSWSDNPELRFDLENCRTLCIPCHYMETFGKKMSKEANWCNVPYGGKGVDSDGI